MKYLAFIEDQFVRDNKDNLKVKRFGFVTVYVGGTKFTLQEFDCPDGQNPSSFFCREINATAKVWKVFLKSEWLEPKLTKEG